MEGNEETVQEEPKKSELVLISKTDLIELINPIIEGINKLGENQVQIYKLLEAVYNCYAAKYLEEEIGSIKRGLMQIDDDLNTINGNLKYHAESLKECVIANSGGGYCDTSDLERKISSLESELEYLR